jgi:hypothetical protein
MQCRRFQAHSARTPGGVDERADFCHSIAVALFQPQKRSASTSKLKAGV